jgi:hypothetical protein
MLDAVHSSWTTGSSVHLVAQTGGHRSEAACLQELGLRQLPSSEACWRGSGAERGGQRSQRDAHLGSRVSVMAGQ